MKAKLVMLQVSLEGLGSSVFDRITVGICWSKVCQMLFAMEIGTSASGMLVVHYGCLLANRISP